MSTGLRRGSFASDEINPLDVTEMLWPEVILLWTMRTVQYSAVQCSAVQCPQVSEVGTTEFERSGRCRVIKHNTFICPETKVG